MFWMTVVAHAKGPELCNGIDDDGNGLLDDGVASIGDVAYSSVGAAVDAALPGEEVWVCPGRHQEGLIQVDVPLTLAGVPGGQTPVLDLEQIRIADGTVAALTHLSLDVNTWSDAAVLVGAQGGLVGRDLSVYNRFQAGISTKEDAEVDLAGSTLQGRSNALRLWYGARARLADSVCHDSRIGVFMVARATLTGGHILDNEIGVAANYEVVSSPLSWVSVSDTLISESVTNGVSIANGSAELLRVRVEQSGDCGVYSGAPLRLESSEIVNNRGCGIMMGNSTLDLFDSTVSGNDDSGIISSGSILGDGISSIENNSGLFGGGIRLVDGFGLAKDRAISGVVISGNIAESGAGVGVGWSLDNVIMDNLVIQDNAASLYGGAIQTQLPVTISNSTVSRNSAWTAGGVRLVAGNGAITSRCTSWGVGLDDNMPGDVSTPVGTWSFGSENLRCDLGGCFVSVGSCELDPPGLPVPPPRWDDFGAPTSFQP